MQWKEIQIINGQARLNFTQQKTKGVEYMPISPQALELCGDPRQPTQLVFEDLPDPSWISRPPLKTGSKPQVLQRKLPFIASVIRSQLCNYLTEQIFTPSAKCWDTLM